MKKQLLLVIAMGFMAILLGCASTTPVDFETTQEKIFETELTKDEIFAKTMVFLTQTINDSEASIEMQDKESGRIIGQMNDGEIVNGSFGSINTVTNITYDITAKDNKVRVILSFNNFIIAVKNAYGNIIQLEKPSSYLDDSYNGIKSGDQRISQQKTFSSFF